MWEGSLGKSKSGGGRCGKVMVSQSESTLSYYIVGNFRWVSLGFSVLETAYFHGLSFVVFIIMIVAMQVAN